MTIRASAVTRPRCSPHQKPAYARGSTATPILVLFLLLVSIILMPADVKRHLSTIFSLRKESFNTTASHTDKTTTAVDSNTAAVDDAVLSVAPPEWDEEDAASSGMPTWCRRLIESPLPHDHYCARSPYNHTCTKGENTGRPTFFGTHAQDFYLYTKHFMHLKRRGVYLDVAANEPIANSNTFFFDRCLRWKGACVEANPGYFEKLMRLRGCALVPSCAAERAGVTVDFMLNGQLGGVLGDTNKHAVQIKDGAMSDKPVVKMRCLALKSILSRKHVRLIDLFSLDVEGHELNVLRGIDWDAVRINVIVVEVATGKVEAMQQYLEEKGYVRHMPDYDERSRRNGLLWEDAIFHRSDVKWGVPV